MLIYTEILQINFLNTSNFRNLERLNQEYNIYCVTGGTISYYRPVNLVFIPDRYFLIQDNMTKIVTENVIKGKTVKIILFRCTSKFFFRETFMIIIWSRRWEAMWHSVVMVRHRHIDA